ncbi:stage III sporulation protein AA [Anaerovorax odorimutans]|uniref:stage III sporulation protein AA n=1 Tax=Anaerovorax odorimutans TaxID=109327 RepID=UPI00040A28A7|nr:stage III sporulation protein AA [Anaerovorax odorimutans]
MDNLNNILMKLPGEVGGQIRSLSNDVLQNLEEIRIKIGSDIKIFSEGKEYELKSQSGLKINKELINKIFNNILNHSAYAYQEELSNGYITIEGGHRVGVCGRTVVENGKIKTIKDISSLNIRRSREIIGVSDPCMKFLVKNKNQIYNTVIVSPPKCGKTTLLRDLIRNLSNMGFKVGVCDERSEISGMYNGYSNYDLGTRTDVLDGCPKDQGMLMLIRSMSPDIIVTDEIGKKQDINAIEASVCAGISLLTTIHGNNYEDILASGIGDLVKRGVFQRFIYLSNVPAVGSISSVRDFRNNVII